METMWITTEDNPFDPFDQFDEWYAFDEDHGYCTCGYIMRIAETSLSQTDDESTDATNEACMEIARLNPNGMYKLVRRTDLDEDEEDEDDDDES